ncbi:flagellar motor protein MotB [Elusimicrobiota bacterium]
MFFQGDENTSRLSVQEEKIQVGRDSPPWMVTYSDLVTQLLIFFVMMFALAASLNEMQLQRIKKRLEKYAYENKLEKVILLEINDKGLVISLNEKLMFDSGNADIYEEAKDILSDISSEIIDIPNNVKIEGHTDSVPIHNDQFPSNWELSTARATNIARFLVEKLRFPPDRISAGGYSKYHPAVFTEYDDVVTEYKAKVREVPLKYSKDLNRARTEEQEDEVHMKIREEQLAVQIEMQDVIKDQLKSANYSAYKRSLNRRVDIIVARMSSTIKRREGATVPSMDAGE